MAPVPPTPTSFVPRQPGSPLVQAPIRRRRRLNLLSLLAVVLFFGSLILSVGVYLLKTTSQDALQAKKDELTSKRALFKREDIENVQALDARIRAAGHLLDAHVSPSRLLAVLESTTQEEIQYQSFEFLRRPSGNVGVIMDGVAPRFNTVARQAQRFADEPMFSRVIFSGLDKPTPAYVSFTVNLDIARDAIAYVAPVNREDGAFEDAEDATTESGDEVPLLETTDESDVTDIGGPI